MRGAHLGGEGPERDFLRTWSLLPCEQPAPNLCRARLARRLAPSSSSGAIPTAPRRGFRLKARGTSQLTCSISSVANLAYCKACVWSSAVQQSAKTEISVPAPHLTSGSTSFQFALRNWEQIGNKIHGQEGPILGPTPTKAVESSSIWRKRVGVEPTIRPASGRISGFEDREDHRTPFASEWIIQK